MKRKFWQNSRESGGIYRACRLYAFNWPYITVCLSRRIVNIHPSLLPAFPGKDAIGQALAAGVSETGVTVHYVDEGMDTGPIIDQQSVVIGENETLDSLAGKFMQ